MVDLCRCVPDVSRSLSALESATAGYNSETASERKGFFIGVIDILYRTLSSKLYRLYGSGSKGVQRWMNKLTNIRQCILLNSLCIHYVCQSLLNV